MYRHFQNIGNTERISLWRSKALSDEIIKLPIISDNSLAPALSYVVDNNWLRLFKTR